MIQQLLNRLARLSNELADITQEVVKLRDEATSDVVQAGSLREGDRFVKLGGDIPHTKISQSSVFHFGLHRYPTPFGPGENVVWACSDNGHLCRLHANKPVRKLPRREAH
jgi:hypothetical protein